VIAQAGELLMQLLRGFGVVPEVGRGGFLF
jgi:hypothetical protein